MRVEAKWKILRERAETIENREKRGQNVILWGWTSGWLGKELYVKQYQGIRKIWGEMKRLHEATQSCDVSTTLWGFEVLFGFDGLHIRGTMGNWNRNKIVTRLHEIICLKIINIELFLFTKNISVHYSINILTNSTTFLPHDFPENHCVSWQRSPK